jgi:hypothetical protein
METLTYGETHGRQCFVHIVKVYSEIRSGILFMVVQCGIQKGIYNACHGFDDYSNV